MKITADAGALSAAFASAASLSTDISTKKFPALTCVHLKAAGDALAVTANTLDCLVSLRIPAKVEAGGEIVVSASRIAKLAAAFAADTEIRIVGESNAARISGAHQRYRLAATPLDTMPPPLALTAETGRVELAVEEARALLRRPSFAASTEKKASFHLCGVLLHETKDGLTSTATDGKRLAKLVIPGAGGLSSDHTLIMPTPSVKIALKLLGDCDVERVALRRSKTLLLIETSKFVLISRLIDSTFPAYERIIPAVSGCCVTIDRAALTQAIDRALAVAQADRPVVGLHWGAGEPVLHLCLVGEDDAATDTVEAAVVGNGRVALLARSVAELLDELSGPRVHLDTNGSPGPVLITDPDDGDFLALDMPCAWPQATSDTVADAVAGGGHG